MTAGTDGRRFLGVRANFGNSTWEDRQSWLPEIAP